MREKAPVQLQSGITVSQFAKYENQSLSRKESSRAFHERITVFVHFESRGSYNGCSMFQTQDKPKNVLINEDTPMNECPY